MCSTTLDSKHKVVFCNARKTILTLQREAVSTFLHQNAGPQLHCSNPSSFCTASGHAPSFYTHKNPKQTESGIIIWSHDLSWRVKGKSHHADKVRIQRLEQQLHQQRLILLNELVTLQEGEHTLRPIHTYTVEPFPTGMELSDWVRF